MAAGRAGVFVGTGGPRLLLLLLPPAAAAGPLRRGRVLAAGSPRRGHRRPVHLRTPWPGTRPAGGSGSRRRVAAAVARGPGLAVDSASEALTASLGGRRARRAAARRCSAPGCGPGPSWSPRCADRAERAEAERELLAREAVLSERTRIAREMHDAVGHRVSLMVLQAGAIEMAADDPDRVAQLAGQRAGRRPAGAGRAAPDGRRAACRGRRGRAARPAARPRRPRRSWSRECRGRRG